MSTDFETLVDQAQVDAYKPVFTTTRTPASKLLQLIKNQEPVLAYKVMALEDGPITRWAVINKETLITHSIHQTLQVARQIAIDLNRMCK